MKLLNLAYREKALKELKNHFFHLLNQDNARHILAFQAPTGSGKTVTMACFLKEIVNELPTHFELSNHNITYIWIAPNALHLQSYASLSNFYSETRDLKTLGISDISEHCLLPNEMLFLNWQSINRDDTIFMRENENGKSFYNIIDQTIANGTEIVVIIDEEHLMAGGKTAVKAEQVLQRINPKIEVRVSATLSDKSLRSMYRVMIPREDVVKAEMIKKGVHLNPQVKADEQAGRDSDIVLLQKSLDKRASIEKDYATIGAAIHPLLLIQLPSDSAKISSEDIRIKDTVVEYLKAQGISENNGKMAVWLSGEKTNLEDISKPDNIVEVLLFKQAIALGWDCPRASVLLVYREMRSETFTVQTMGRILRMPQQKHYENEALNYGYVYTNLNKDLITLLPEESDYITENKAVRQADIYTPVGLKSYYIERAIERNRIGLNFREALQKAAEQLFGIQKPLGDSSSPVYFKNKEAMELSGVSMTIRNVEIRIPADVNLDVTTVGGTQVEHIERFVKTTFQLERLFERFCFGSCGEYQKDGSWERIKYHTEMLFEEYFSMAGTDIMKIVLNNQSRFTDLYNLARELYGKLMKEKAAQHKTTKLHELEKPWEVPEFKMYNDKYVVHKTLTHALEPLYARARGNKQTGNLFDSDNEYHFIDELIKHENSILWWYKNGSSSKEDFAIPYTKQNGTLSLFYVDIVIKFKDGTVCLFDPKTQESDPENVLKHNALIEYVEKLQANGKKILGSIVIPKDGSWRYCQNRIENDKDLTGWDFFNPANFSTK